VAWDRISKNGETKFTCSPAGRVCGSLCTGLWRVVKLG